MQIQEKKFFLKKNLKMSILSHIIWGDNIALSAAFGKLVHIYGQINMLYNLRW
jgi:hypothetical protein